MRVFTISDIHIDYEKNKEWLLNLSEYDFQNDILILAGDVTHSTSLLEIAFRHLSGIFRKILFVPGNHDLWVRQNKTLEMSTDKDNFITNLCKDYDIGIEPYHHENLSIVPLHSWYDYSFGEPGEKLKTAWADYYNCKWPEGYNESKITKLFLEKNLDYLKVQNKTVISFSHFLPRIDIMPSYIPKRLHYIYPVLGTNLLLQQLRVLKPNIHIYGHSHVNRSVKKENIRYINNAFGYPNEGSITAKELLMVHEV